MTPPRGDNWAGCLGMTAGPSVVSAGERRFVEVARAALVCGFIGGIGFAAASMLKLVEVTSGYETNWHSILEQTTGLFNGIGLAVAVCGLAHGERPISSRQPGRESWTEPFALGFVVLGITYLNLRKNVAQWVAVHADAGRDGRHCAGAWFDLGYFLLALTLLASVGAASEAAVGDRAGELAGQGTDPLSRAALVAGRRQFRAYPRRLHGAAAGDRRRDLCRRLGLHAHHARVS